MDKVKQRKAVKKETLCINESTYIHRKKGNGIVKRQIWVDENNQVSRYSLAYINHHLFQEDNGRVLGYDNAHGYHHKHLMGIVESVEFTRFEDIEIKFQQEFEALHEHTKKNH